METLEELIKQKKECRNNLGILSGINLIAGVLPFAISYTISKDNPDILYSTFSSMALMGFSFLITIDKIFEESIKYNEIKKKIDYLS